MLCSDDGRKKSTCLHVLIGGWQGGREKETFFLLKFFCLSFAFLAAAFVPLLCARGCLSTMPKGIPAPGPWDMPGDNANLENEGLAEGEHIFIRMGTIVRARRLDLRLLMDAHDLHNRGFVDKQTFFRSLGYAFGNQWNELGMTTKEFEEVIEPYSIRKPEKWGEPMCYVYWQKFANHVQKIADSMGTGKQGDY